MTHALEGIRVLDLSRILAGPWCSQNLADLGADVIKVERPGTGDDTRHWGPPWLACADANASPDAAYFAIANRGKRSLALDIATAAGQEAIRALVATSHILIENYKVGDLKRYGLDYESLSAINPALVYCSITGYGQEGPKAHKPGYDFIFQGLGGVMSVTGEKDGLPGAGPQRAGLSIVDILTGMYASVAILGALRHAERTGEGQHLDIALLDCVVAAGANLVTQFAVTGEVPQRYGNAHPVLVPYHVFATADGHMIVAAGNDKQWQAYCHTIERPDLAQDARFTTGAGRIQHRDVLVAMLQEQMRLRSTQHWITCLEDASIPCGPINTYADVLADPQVKFRELTFQHERADGSNYPVVRSPLRLSKTPVEYLRPPPTLGQHTDEVLTQALNLTPEQLHALGVIS